jgi:hypothetical protein
MSTCSNCKKSLSCGCQKRTAVNGASVCSNCVTAYNKTLTDAGYKKQTTTKLYTPKKT